MATLFAGALLAACGRVGFGDLFEPGGQLGDGATAGTASSQGGTVGGGAEPSNGGSASNGGASSGSGNATTGGNPPVVGGSAGTGGTGGSTAGVGGIVEAAGNDAGGNGPDGEAGAAGMPVRFCPPDCDFPTLLATGFEEETTGTVRTSGQGATVQISATETHNGTGALEAVQPDEHSNASLNFPITKTNSGALYFRGYVYVPEGVVDTGFKVFGFATDFAWSVDVNLIAGGAVNVFLHQPDTSTSSPPLSYPEGRWFCLQVADFIDDQGSVEVSVDGQKVLTVPGDTHPLGGVSQVDLGAVFTFPEQQDTRVLIDDVVVATQPIDCQ